jgi:hypothetical protein
VVFPIFLVFLRLKKRADHHRKIKRRRAPLDSCRIIDDPSVARSVPSNADVRRRVPLPDEALARLGVAANFSLRVSLSGRTSARPLNKLRCPAKALSEPLKTGSLPVVLRANVAACLGFSQRAIIGSRRVPGACLPPAGLARRPSQAIPDNEVGTLVVKF